MFADVEMVESRRDIGGEEVLRAMCEDDLLEVGRKTYSFVRSVLRNPDTRIAFEKKKAELAATGYFTR